MPFGHIDRYVLQRTLAGVLIASTVISTIILLICFVELSRTVGASAKDVTGATLLGLALLEAPAIVLMLLPFAFLFGVLGAYVNLNRRNELIAFRAAGVSAWRFILPVASAAAMVGIATVLVFNPIASKMTEAFQKLQTQLMQGYLNEGPKPIWIRQGDRHRQVIIEATPSGSAGVDLRHVKVFVFDLDAGGNLKFSDRFDAERATLGHGAWNLSHVHEGRPGQPPRSFDTVAIASPLSERTALERFSSPVAVPFWSLPGVIARTEQAGFSATGYRIQLQQLLATPLMFAAMSLLGAAFSLRLLRLGGLAGLAASGVGLGFAFFFLNQFFFALGKGGVIPAFVAGWTPPTLALLCGLTLLCYTEDG